MIKPKRRALKEVGYGLAWVGFAAVFAWSVWATLLALTYDVH